jgi:ABC-type multidrug transport system fused ATPase/permease subunit
MERWPWYGTIQIDGLQIKYDLDMPMVLKGISCTFPGERKIGVVGRTGSGKSTLIQALFRIVEPSAGRILIDGVDISLLGLHDLRSRLSIIPQEPTLFQGTVRSNLDPLQQHTDAEIWEVRQYAFSILMMLYAIWHFINTLTVVENAVLV